MRLLLNLLWIVFGGGFLICLEYLLAGGLLCLTIVGIPFGLQCFKLAGLGLLPFGQGLVRGPSANPVGCVFNVLWAVFAGIWILLSHVTLAVGLAVTIIGIPFAWQHLKFATVALVPFGTRVEPLP